MLCVIRINGSFNYCVVTAVTPFILIVFHKTSFESFNEIYVGTTMICVTTIIKCPGIETFYDVHRSDVLQIQSLNL